MFIIYGSSLYGRVDRVPGLMHVATKFAHLFYVPLIPVKSFIVFDGSENGQGFRGTQISLSLKSVVVGWLRAAIVVGMLVLVAISAGRVFHFLDVGREPLERMLTPLVAAVGVFALFRLSRLLTRARPARARDLAAQAGLDPDAVVARLQQPSAPKRFDRVSMALGIAAGLLVLSGVLAHAGLLPGVKNFKTLSLAEVREFKQEHRFLSEYEYVQLDAAIDSSRMVCFKEWENEIVPPEQAEHCCAPVVGFEDEVYAKFAPADRTSFPRPLVGVLDPQGESNLNTALGRTAYGAGMGVLDLPWGARSG